MRSTRALDLGHAGRFDEAEDVLLRAKSFSDQRDEGHAAREKVESIRR